MNRINHELCFEMLFQLEFNLCKMRVNPKTIVSF